MSEKRFIPRDPKGKSMEHLAADIRTQAIAKIKAAYPSDSWNHWKDLQEEGWIVLDLEGPPQQELY
jgi:hypothetical protein